ncbi:hypothetical protein Golomagni_07069 [Golovinomyces magnicellulatus]|nr:hypothetical protein Golomagni_07069 [Golovinomyces magnicellulatus]
MKDDKQVIREFNNVVNMTAGELDNWLKDSKSSQAGWSKEDGSGETVGHDSGRKITAILKSNPNKSPGKYTEDQIKHMRKVVAYCNRHLAQEKGSLDNKSTAEAKNSKSYISLKNWGHDPLKNQRNRPDSNDEDAAAKKKKGQTEQAGEKRKQSSEERDSPERS